MLDPLLRCRIVTRWENRHTLWLRDNFTRQRIDLRNSLHLIAKKFDPLRRILPRRINIHHITPHPKISPRKVDVIALVLNIREQPHKFILLPTFTPPNRNRHLRIRLWRPDTIDTAHARHDDRIAPRQ